MSLAYLFDSNIQFQDRSGNNNVNGFLRVYIDDTDDRAVTYKDFNGTLNQADIRLDNNGRAVVIVDDSKTYRLEVYGTTGVRLWTLYPISPKATGINETLEALVAAVKSHTIAIEGLALGKKNKQQAKVISGIPTKTVKSISQNADGEFTVEFEDIAFPHKVLVDEEDSVPKHLEDAIMADEQGQLKLYVDEKEDSTPESPNKVLVIDDSVLRERIDNNAQRIENLEETIDEMDFDSVPRAYLASTLNQSPGDSVTTRTTINVFSVTAIEGDCFEFEQTTTIDDTPFGYVWIEPGTYLINAAVTLQWVGNPRGTFIAKVGSVMGENFDFSQEQEISRQSTKVVTIPSRMKLAFNVTYDAGTPVMGFWIQSVQVVKLAGGMSQTNIIHDDTLVGQGSVSDPLGVDEEKVAQSTLAGNLAPEFDPTRTEDTKYLAGESVAYEGKTYTFKVNHYGPWDASDVSRKPLFKNSCQDTIFDKMYIFSYGGILGNGQDNPAQVHTRIKTPKFVLNKKSTPTFSCCDGEEVAVYRYREDGIFVSEGSYGSSADLSSFDYGDRVRFVFRKTNSSEFSDSELKTSHGVDVEFLSYAESIGEIIQGLNNFANNETNDKETQLFYGIKNRLYKNTTNAVGLDTVEIWLPNDAPSIYESDNDRENVTFPLGYYEFISNFYDSLKEFLPKDYTISKNIVGMDASGNYNIYEYDLCPKNWDRCVLLSAGMNACETTAIVALAEYLKHVLRDNDANLPFVREHVRLKVIPIICPWSFDQEKLKYGNYNGVNINRNFDYRGEWKDITTGGYFNKGNAPESEAETKLLKKWVSENAKIANCYIDCHTDVGSLSTDTFYSMASTYTACQKIISAQSKIIDYYASQGIALGGRSCWVPNGTNYPKFLIFENEMGVTNMMIEQQANWPGGNGMNCSKASIENYECMLNAYLIALTLSSTEKFVAKDLVELNGLVERFGKEVVIPKWENKKLYSGSLVNASNRIFFGWRGVKNGQTINITAKRLQVREVVYKKDDGSIVGYQNAINTISHSSYQSVGAVLWDPNGNEQPISDYPINASDCEIAINGVVPDSLWTRRYYDSINQVLSYNMGILAHNRTCSPYIPVYSNTLSFELPTGYEVVDVIKSDASENVIGRVSGASGSKKYAVDVTGAYYLSFILKKSDNSVIMCKEAECIGEFWSFN